MNIYKSTCNGIWAGYWDRRGYYFDTIHDKSRSLDIVIDNDRVEGTIFEFSFSKKYYLSLHSIEGQVLDRCRAFDWLVSLDAHLCR